MRQMPRKKLVTPAEEVIALAVADAQLKAMEEEEKFELKPCTPEVLADVLNGKYGKGIVKTRKLIKAGYDPESVNDMIDAVYELADKIKKFKKKSGEYWDVIVNVILPD